MYETPIQNLKISRPILIMMAMRGEAAPLIRALNLVEVPSVFGPHLPTLCFKGTFGNRKVILLLNGVYAPTQVDLIGTQVASFTALLGIRELNPSCVFNFGTCGALSSRGALINDLFLIGRKVWYHTRRIPISGFEPYSWGGYPAAGTPEQAQRLGFKLGVLSTTESLDFPEIDSDRFLSLQADVADMEGAAIACLCEMYQIPFYALKGVTDLMDAQRPTGEQFQENFQKVVENISRGAIALLSDVIEEDGMKCG